MGKNYAKEIQIAKNIYFSEEIHGVLIEGKEIRLSRELYDFLECLVRAKGSYVSPTYFINEVLDIPSDVDNTENLVKDTVKRLRKILGDTGKNKTIIKNMRDVGYCLGQYREIGQALEYPFMLTKTVVPNVTPESVMFREKEVELIIHYLNADKKSISLYGFGGVGKTSLARLVYSTIKNHYDSVGWIEYHTNLKTSMVECLDWNNPFFSEQNEAKTVNDKWFYLSNLIKNSKKKKLLIIDNVDIDHEIGQDPGSDYQLTEISGWINTDVIIPELNGYYNMEITNLGDNNDDNNCVELFYHYCNEAATKREENLSDVRKIIKLVGYNTMVIELLAKSCFYEESVSRYYDKLLRVGFDTLSLPVVTMHNTGAETATEQIKRLFAISRRSNMEKTIIASFKLLAEGEKVSVNEFETWLGYKLKDVDQLVKEGWISFKGASFSIHPLIRQAITLSSNLKKLHQDWIQQNIQNKNHTSLYFRLKTQTLFDVNDSFAQNLRKLSFVDRLTMEYVYLDNSTLIYLGDYARKIGCRDLAIKQYKKVYSRLSDKIDTFYNKIRTGAMTHEDMMTLWKAVFYYGYMLSYTKNGMLHAKEVVRRAVEVAEAIDYHDHTDESLGIYATSLDHLGYILSCSCEGNKERYFEARRLLRESMQIRLDLSNKYSKSIEYLHDLAWSKDNIGFLMANSDESYFNEQVDGIDALQREQKLAECYLREALGVRKRILESHKDKQAFSEVAWTLCNLGVCLSKTKDENNEAKSLFSQAIDIYEELEKQFPGFEKASLARTLSSFANMMIEVNDEREQGLKLLYRALIINNQLEGETPGIYTGEIKHINDEIQRVLGTDGNKGITIRNRTENTVNYPL